MNLEGVNVAGIKLIYVFIINSRKIFLLVINMWKTKEKMFYFFSFEVSAR